jgi:uncharacterized membrane protein
MRVATVDLSLEQILRMVQQLPEAERELIAKALSSANARRRQVKKQAGKAKPQHIAALRQGYAAAAKESLALTREWEPLDDEVWAKLDRIEARVRKAQ